MNSTVSVVIELPEALHQSFLKFLDGCPEWDQDRAMSASLALFLLQNRTTNTRENARLYLDSLFKRPVEQL